MNANVLLRDAAHPIQIGDNVPDCVALEISRNVLEQLPAYIVRADRAVPIDLDGDVLVVAMENPGNCQLQERIRFIANRELRIAVATSAAIDHLIEVYYACEEDAE